MDLPISQDLAIVVPTHHKKESLSLLGIAYASLREGGTLLLSCENQRGAKSYRKELFALGGEGESWSKNHCVVAWVRKDSEKTDTTLLTEMISYRGFQPIPTTPFVSHVGLYGWDKIDEGSQLLVDTLPLPQSGRGADLGCGYGFITYQVLSKPHSINAMILIDSEALAIEAAKRNIGALTSLPLLNFQWGDVTALPSDPRFDWVIMNPPCHREDSQDTELGKRFIEKARSLLRPGGVLQMVVLEHLAYEETLRNNFKAFANHLRSKGFKIISAQA